jgi:hypothetical protein
VPKSENLFALNWVNYLGCPVPAYPCLGKTRVSVQLNRTSLAAFGVHTSLYSPLAPEIMPPHHQGGPRLLSPSTVNTPPLPGLPAANR